MTKSVRIENADMAAYQVIVQVWDKGVDGQPDVMAEERTLMHPTEMAHLHITSTRYIVVKEHDQRIFGHAG